MTLFINVWVVNGRLEDELGRFEGIFRTEVDRNLEGAFVVRRAVLEKNIQKKQLHKWFYPSRGNQWKAGTYRIEQAGPRRDVIISNIVQSENVFHRGISHATKFLCKEI